MVSGVDVLAAAFLPYGECVLKWQKEETERFWRDRKPGSQLRSGPEHFKPSPKAQKTLGEWLALSPH